MLLLSNALIHLEIFRKIQSNIQHENSCQFWHGQKSKKAVLYSKILRFDIGFKKTNFKIDLIVYDIPS